MHIPASGSVSLYLWSDDPLRVRVAQANEGDVRVESAELAADDTSAVEAARALTSALSHRVFRVRIFPREDDRIPIPVALGGQPAAAVARLEGGAKSALCALTLGNYPILAGSYDGFERVLMDNARPDIFGAGWHDFEDDPNGGIRWTSRDPAHLLVPIGHVRDMRLALDAFVPAQGNHRVAIAVNGRWQPGFDGIAGWHRYEWIVPATEWKMGTNDLAIGGAGLTRRPQGLGDERAVGVGVREIDFQARP
jgi:hypothetical protein